MRQPTLSATHKPRYDVFMAACKGISTHLVAKSLNRLISGVNFKGCSKGRLAEYYAKNAYPEFTRLDIGKFAAELKAKTPAKATGQVPASASVRRGFYYVALVAETDLQQDLAMDANEGKPRFTAQNKADIQAALQWLRTNSETK